MTKLDDLWAEIQKDSALPSGSASQAWQDMKAGVQPAAINDRLNQLALGLLHTPQELYQTARHPLNALRSMYHHAQQASANNLRTLRQMDDPRATPAQRQQAQDRWLAQAAPVLAGVIKEPGGNWLSGGVERALKPLKKPAPVLSGYILNQASGDENFWHNLVESGKHGNLYNTIEQEHPELYRKIIQEQNPAFGALNDWIDQKLTRYVKNDMGTPRDPVRALAEQGILHVPPEQLNYNAALHGDPRWISPGEQHVAVSDAAKRWEGAADRHIVPFDAEDMRKSPGILPENPWLSKLNPHDQVYTTLSGAGSIADPHMAEDLGFNHLVDELHNAVRPNSDLPGHLRLTPDQLGKTNVPQAVQLVHKINQWREKQQVEANLQLAKNPATHVLKEYKHIPGTTNKNLKGLHWVELKQPTGVEIDPIAPNRNLENALKYEGDQMGHCVGGYCPDVSGGRSRIFSLRDAKGQPHVTVETQQSGSNRLTYDEARANVDRMPDLDENEKMEMLFRNGVVDAEGNPIHHPVQHSIVQIKGKANRAPNPEYLPFVQDLVRGGVPEAGASWNSVEDLGNTGLYELPDGRYATEAEMRQAAANLGQPDMDPRSLHQLTRRPTMWPNMLEEFSHVPTQPQ